MVDDFGISATGTKAELAKKVPQACAELARLVHTDAGCHLAEEAEALVGSDSDGRTS